MIDATRRIKVCKLKTPLPSLQFAMNLAQKPCFSAKVLWLERLLNGRRNEAVKGGCHRNDQRLTHKVSLHEWSFSLLRLLYVDSKYSMSEIRPTLTLKANPILNSRIGKLSAQSYHNTIGKRRFPELWWNNMDIQEQLHVFGLQN